MTDIRDIGLPTYLQNALRAGDVFTVEQLLDMGESRWRRIDNIGKKSVLYIRHSLQEHGYLQAKKEDAANKSISIDTKISLRDWFAGMALQGMLSAEINSRTVPHEYFIAVDAYMYADAMLEARNAD